MKKIYSFCLCLVAMLLSLTAMAQQTVKGTVIDEAGQPVIGATVIVKGTNQGTTTGIDGAFQIVVPAKGELQVSYIGYITENIADFKNTKIVLKEDRQNIEEVVVVGYGSQKKAHLTGSVATVQVSEVADAVGGDLATALAGMMNGVSVSGGDNLPGERAKIYIRDANSLADIGSSAQEPLYVIDGYMYPTDVTMGNVTTNLGAETFSNLDPSMIESISVLKDASAAVYGARAANGVVLVTTKRGKVGAPQVSYSASIGVADAISHPKMLNAYQYGRLYNIMKTANPTTQSTQLNATTDLFQLDELEAMKGLNYNLLDEHWSAAVKQKHSVNVTGATERVNYFAGISYFDQDGNMGSFSYNRWNYRAGVDVKFTNWLKGGLSVTGDYGEKSSALVKIGGSNQRNDYNMLLMRPRYIPEYVTVLEDSGKYVDYPLAPYGVSNNAADNNQLYHYDLMQNNGDRSQNMTSNLNIAANLAVDFEQLWKPLKGLTARMSYSKSIVTDKTNQRTSGFSLYKMTTRTGSGEHLYTPVAGQDYKALAVESNFVEEKHQNANGGSGSAFLSRTMDRADSYQLNFQVNYARDFGKHSVGAMFNIEKSETESEYLMGQVADPYDFTTGQSTTAYGAQTTEFKRSESGSLSYLGRVNYAYDDKYLFEALLRIDSSTKFSPDNYWGYFPSASIGWVVSKESWFADNVKWVDFLKLRGSFGLTGRDNLTPWQWMQSYSATDGQDKGPIFGTDSGAKPNTHLSLNKNISALNPDAHWDKSYKMNIGMDLNVLNNRLGFVVEGYKEWNRDMLMTLDQDIPGTVGTGSAAYNYGEMDSWGIEFAANWSDRIGKDFKYKIGINTGYSDNKVLMMDWVVNENYYKAVHPGQRSDVGSWGMQCIGMFRSYQEIHEYFETYGVNSYMKLSKENVHPGMLIYKDIRGAYNAETKTYGGPDGIVNEYDEVRLSNRANPYGLTVNLGAEWKGLSLTAQISASWGGYSFVSTDARETDNIEAFSMPSFWNPENVFSYQDIYDVNGNLLIAENRDASMPNPAFGINSQTSSFWRVSGTRVQMRRLTLAYTLPKEWLKPIGISSVRFNITGTNLFSFYNPYPDNFMDPMSGSYGNYPTLRNITLGVNVSF